MLVQAKSASNKSPGGIDEFQDQDAKLWMQSCHRKRNLP